MASTKSRSASSYSVLLLQKLLNLRDDISPLTLVLDSAQQSGTLVVEEMMLRAKAAGTKIIYVKSYSAGGRKSPHIDILIERRRKSLATLRDEIASKCQPPPAPAGQPARGPPPQKFLVVMDSLSQIAQQDPLHVGAFVSSIVSPALSVLGIYHHNDEPFSFADQSHLTAGKPSPLKVLSHLATAILRVHPVHQEVAKKRARDRSEEEPRFGLADGEGGIFSYSGRHDRYNKYDYVNPPYDDAIVLDMELRRRSGRAMVERYVVVWGTEKTETPLSRPGTGATTEAQGQKLPPQTRFVKPWDAGAAPCTDITVMSHHPLFAAAADPGMGNDTVEDGEEEDVPESTFNLGLTDKQRKDREGIVLPYFDAQTDIGAGEGGRILYEMGREDDFDDEEDEI